MNGRAINDPLELHDSAVDYFKHMLYDNIEITEEPIMSNIEPTIDAEINEALCDSPTMEEIKKVVFNFSKDASSGPAGFPAIFYTTCWEVIKEDLLEAIEDFFLGAALPVGISSTSITLIPKVENPLAWSDFRPISLCNCSHKILSMLLNDRLATVLPGLISENQSGFLQGRLISDNLLLTQELIHSLDVKTRGSNIALKIDMQKAYDRLNWKFLCSCIWFLT